MALVKPLIVGKLSIPQLFQHIFLYNPKKFNQESTQLKQPEQEAPRESLRTIFKRHLDGAFIETYGFDGYKEDTTEIITAEGQRKEDGSHYTYESDDLPLRLALMSFFGIPNRVKYIEDTDNSLVIDGRQVLKNFVGGINDNAGDEKKFWQSVASFTVKPFIFIIKICLIFFKTPLNTLKLFTEFLPKTLWRFSEEIVLLLDEHRKQEWAKQQLHLGRWLLKGVILFADVVGLTLFASILAASRVISIFGRILTSPEVSARVALGFGKQLENPWLGWIVGVGALLLSLFLTALFWAIALPVIFSIVTTVFPATIPALTALSKFPLFTAVVGMTKTGAITLGGAIGAAFAPPVTAIGAALGIKTSATALTVFATSGLFVAPVATGLSWCSDKFSNAWADWVDGEFFTPSLALWGGYTKLDDNDVKLEARKGHSHPGQTPSPATPGSQGKLQPTAGATSAVQTQKTAERTAASSANREFDDSADFGGGGYQHNAVAAEHTRNIRDKRIPERTSKKPANSGGPDPDLDGESYEFK